MNILMITSIYPQPVNNSTTKICHYFTKEWQKSGYNVKVVHFYSIFPKIYHFVGNLFRKRIMAKTGCVVYKENNRKYKNYTMDGVDVLFVPILKFIPHTSFSKKKMNNAVETVCKELEKKEFVPDIITGHLVLPQLEAIYLMKKQYKDARTAIIFHSSAKEMPKIYPTYEEYLKSIDIIGFRSEPFRKEYFRSYGETHKNFICYSGIPNGYIKESPKSFENGIKKFSFLGSLFKLKKVDNTLRALKESFGDDEFCFDVIGDGAEYSYLKSLSSELKIDDRVNFLGRLYRNEAQRKVEASECFIMVSKPEAFGLVYLEAMAKGCITIGTKGQGIDGIIIHGENGFLCEADNIDELVDLLNHIKNLTSQELQDISNAAIQTAKELTDEKVAENYINSVIDFLKK